MKRANGRLRLGLRLFEILYQVFGVSDIFLLLMKMPSEEDIY